MVQQEQQAAVEAAAVSKAAAAELQQQLDDAWQHQEAAVAAAAAAAEAEVSALRQQLEAAQQLQEQLGAGQQQLQQQVESMAAEHQQASTHVLYQAMLRCCKHIPRPASTTCHASCCILLHTHTYMPACLHAACLPAWLQELDVVGEENSKLMDLLAQKQVGGCTRSVAVRRSGCWLQFGDRGSGMAALQ